ncbi:MAG: hypothetical protein JNJ89_17130 [Rubrivivax sp.]|nr:hypothetical protein [Rubrivivax sp.]
MDKRFLVAWLATFVAWMAGSFVVHGTLLQGEYAKLPQLFRPQAEAGRYFPLMLLAHVVMAGALVWIYARGVQARPWLGQGLRYGVAVALLTVVPTYTIYYAVQPMPGGMVVQQIVYDGILLVLLGALVAWLHRDRATTG